MMRTNRFLALVWVALLAVGIILLAGCHHRQDAAPRPEVIPTPVSNPCATARPVEPVPLNKRMTEAEFLALSHKQRVAHVGQWSMEVARFAKGTNAATAACPEIEPE